MDIFNEYIVKRKRSGKDWAKIVGILIGSLILCYVLMIVVSQMGSAAMPFFFPAIVGVAFLDWYLIRQFCIEYEYSVTNGYLVVDQIIARSRRKRLIAFECRDVDEMKKYDPGQSTESLDRVLFADDQNPLSERWSVELMHKDLGHVRLVFTPSERILAAIKPFLKRQVSFHAFGR